MTVLPAKGGKTFYFNIYYSPFEYKLCTNLLLEFYKNTSGFIILSLSSRLMIWSLIKKVAHTGQLNDTEKTHPCCEV